MAELIVMPKLSDTMEEGVIANWLKKEGDKVSEGDLLAEIETDKATMEYEAPSSGILLKLIAKPGSKLSLGEPIAILGKAGEKVDLEALTGKAKKKEAPGEQTPQVVAKSPAKSDVSQVSQESPKAMPPSASPAKSASGGGRVVASPLAKKIAKDAGVDISQVLGSGPNGRIIAKDLEKGIAGGSRSFPGPSVVATAQDRTVPATMMRQTIAKRLHAAKNDAPHFYLTRSCDMSAVIGWRKRLNDAAEKNPDLAKVSVNDIILMACARALAQHRNVNASWKGDATVEFGAVHVAMAVALPTGLITPVIRNCDKLGVREIAAQSRELATRAKNGDLKPEDYSGGTFTVSNLGMFGIEEFTAIINPPQAAILAVGATVPTPWADSKGQLAVAQRMKMTLSCDHRVIDGAMGAVYLQTLVGYLEDPLAMLS